MANATESRCLFRVHYKKKPQSEPLPFFMTEGLVNGFRPRGDTKVVKLVDPPTFNEQRENRGTSAIQFRRKPTVIPAIQNVPSTSTASSSSSLAVVLYNPPAEEEDDPPAAAPSTPPPNSPCYSFISDDEGDGEPLAAIEWPEEKRTKAKPKKKRRRRRRAKPKPKKKPKIVDANPLAVVAVPKEKEERAKRVTIDPALGIGSKANWRRGSSALKPVGRVERVEKPLAIGFGPDYEPERELTIAEKIKLQPRIRRQSLQGLESQRVASLLSAHDELENKNRRKVGKPRGKKQQLAITAKPPVLAILPPPPPPPIASSPPRPTSIYEFEDAVNAHQAYCWKNRSPKKFHDHSYSSVETTTTTTVKRKRGRPKKSAKTDHDKQAEFLRSMFLSPNRKTTVPEGISLPLKKRAAIPTQCFETDLAEVNNPPPLALPEPPPPPPPETIPMIPEEATETDSLSIARRYKRSRRLKNALDDEIVTTQVDKTVKLKEIVATKVLIGFALNDRVDPQFRTDNNVPREEDAVSVEFNIVSHPVDPSSPSSPPPLFVPTAPVPPATAPLMKLDRELTVKLTDIGANLNQLLLLPSNAKIEMSKRKETSVENNSAAAENVKTDPKTRTDEFIYFKENIEGGELPSQYQDELCCVGGKDNKPSDGPKQKTVQYKPPRTPLLSNDFTWIASEQTDEKEDPLIKELRGLENELPSPPTPPKTPPDAALVQQQYFPNYPLDMTKKVLNLNHHLGKTDFYRNPNGVGDLKRQQPSHSTHWKTVSDVSRDSSTTETNNDRDRKRDYKKNKTKNDGTYEIAEQRKSEVVKLKRQNEEPPPQQQQQQQQISPVVSPNRNNRKHKRHVVETKTVIPAKPVFQRSALTNIPQAESARTIVEIVDMFGGKPMAGAGVKRKKDMLKRTVHIVQSPYAPPPSAVIVPFKKARH